MSGEGMRYGAKQIEAMSTEELLAAYKETGQQELKWPLVLRYQELVKRIALQIRGIYSSFAQLDDVINEGILTLLDAVDKYDPDKGIKFETYVTKRIRGMVIDLARRQDWTPRSVRRKAREIDQATWELYSALGRFPTDGEMAQRLGVAESKYQEDLVDISLCNVISLDAGDPGPIWLCCRPAQHGTHRAARPGGPAAGAARRAGPRHPVLAGKRADGAFPVLPKRPEYERDRRGDGGQRTPDLPDPHQGHTKTAAPHGAVL